MSQFFRKYTYYIYSIFELLLGFKNPFRLISIFTRSAASGVSTIQLRQSGLKFRVRGAMDVWSIKETFLDRFYEVYGFTVQPGWTVLDIGAALGEYTLFAARVPGSKVFGFEPFPESFALLKENLQLNHLENVQPFEEAIGAKSGSLILDLSGNEPIQFQSLEDQPLSNQKSLTVRASTLADVFARLGIEACDLLKLDCEGAEFDILLNTSPELLKKIDHIVMEYHDHLTKHNHRELVSFLEAQGFQVDAYPNPVHAYLGYLRAGRKMDKS